VQPINILDFLELIITETSILVNAKNNLKIAKNQSTGEFLYIHTHANLPLFSSDVENV